MAGESVGRRRGGGVGGVDGECVVRSVVEGEGGAGDGALRCGYAAGRGRRGTQ